MKKEIRLLGIDDAPFDRLKDRKTLLLGVLFRGGTSIDGVLSEIVEVDGTDSTDKIIRMVKKSRFYTQLRAIMMKGIAVGGFNLIDVEKVSKKTGVPVIVVMRRLPDRERIARVLEKLGKKDGVKLMEKAGRIHRAGSVLIQFNGITLEKAREIVRISTTRSNVPEPVRVAHIMASGVTLGHSRGKA